ncbi:hypothetical protein ACSBR1_009397 [Camellia fascicularis]
MGMRNQNNGFAVGTGKSQSIDDHVLTPDYVRSLSGSSLNRPRLEIEVVLGHNQRICQGHGLKQVNQIQNGPKGQANNTNEGCGAIGPDARDSSVSEA